MGPQFWKESENGVNNDNALIKTSLHSQSIELIVWWLSVLLKQLKSHQTGVAKFVPECDAIFATKWKSDGDSFVKNTIRKRIFAQQCLKQYNFRLTSFIKQNFFNIFVLFCSGLFDFFPDFLGPTVFCSKAVFYFPVFLKIGIRTRDLWIKTARLSPLPNMFFLFG